MKPKLNPKSVIFRAWQAGLEAMRRSARWFGQAKWRMAIAGSLFGAVSLYCLDILKTDGIGTLACVAGDTVRYVSGGGILVGKAPSAAACQKVYEAFQWGPFLLTAGIFCFSALFLTQIAGGVMWSRLRLVSDSEDESRVLVAGLSLLRLPEGARRDLLDETKRLFAGKSALYSTLKPSKHRSPEDLQILQALEAELGQTLSPVVSGTALNWQQLIRAIDHNHSTLEAVYILPSTQTLLLWDGEARPFLGALFPDALIGEVDRAVDRQAAGRRLVIDLVRGRKGAPFSIERRNGSCGVDYDNYDHTRAGLEWALDQAQKDFRASRRRGAKPLKDSQICVDMTAGLKIFSVAAMIVTLNRDVRLSYVSNDGIVSVFDAEIGLANMIKDKV